MVIALALFVLCGAGLWGGGGQETTTTGPGMAAIGKYNEAPMLAAMVAAGELPPVDQRLPKEPVVKNVIDEIGDYGGTLNVFHTGPRGKDFSEDANNGPGIFTADENGNIVGDIMEGYEMASDNMSITITMREGIKWSDGAPLTMDDMLFTWDDMHINPDVGTWSPQGGNVLAIEALDDLSFRLDFEKPAPDAPLRFVTGPNGVWHEIYPFHFLKQWHIKYNADAEKNAKDEGYDTWQQAFQSHYGWQLLKDVNKPTLQPWVMTQLSSELKVFDRNPYYFKVDPEGNQLPYIDRIVAQIVSAEVYNLKIISGESDFASQFTVFDNFTLYKENEAAGNYKVYTMPSLEASSVTFIFNLSIEDPVKNEVLNDLRFKHAMSLAMNRDEINEVVFFGQGVARQATMLPKEQYYKQEWADSYAEYDPVRANALLDEMGMNKRDSEGFRLGPDGKPFLLVIEITTGEEGGGALETTELVKEYWEDVGVKTLIKALDNALFRERQGLGLHDLKKRATEVDNHFRIGHWAPLWSRWIGAKRNLDAGTLKLEEGESLPGIEPPQWAKDYEELFFSERTKYAPNSKEWLAIYEKIFDIQAERILLMGTVGMVPHIITAKNNVGNVFKEYKPHHIKREYLFEDCDQVFIRQ
jgi:peptide/nickel transport system substrate-binding protein